ncbi:MAG: hypothetical protein ACI9Z3_000928, partial [Roseivirga sp.]
MEDALMLLFMSRRKSYFAKMVMRFVPKHRDRLP